LNLSQVPTRHRISYGQKIDPRLLRPFTRAF
jgi:hypothetical protein